MGTPEARIEMAIAAVKNEKISKRAAAERFGIPRATLDRKIKNGPDGPCKTEDPEPVITKDGKLRHPPASPELIIKAWELSDAGSTRAEIAKTLNRSWPTVNCWLSRPRPEPVGDAPAPAAEPLNTPPPQADEKRKKSPVSDAIKKIHRKEERRIRERWQPIAEHLKAAHDLIRAEKERLCREYAGPQGNLIMQRRWQAMAEVWAEAGQLDQFAEITGEPKAVTLEGLMEELERSSRMANGWIKSVSIYTGCKPDPTRYQGE